MEYYYFVLIFFSLLIIFRLYVKITYKFWAYQPVFHYYNLFYWIYPIGIINKDLPLANKYCNFINITSKSFFEYGEKEIEQMVNLIREHYNRNKDIEYLPTVKYFTSHFTGHSENCYISIYNNPVFKLKNREKTEETEQNSENKIVKENSIIGVITGKPINITLKKALPIKFPAYYVDFLCVDREHREKNIAPQLIQTYEYTQRHNNNKSKVSLFKREGKLTGIVPLTVYKNYMFNTFPIKSKNNNNANIVSNIIRINSTNFDLLTNFIDSNIKNFDCIAIINKSNLLHLIDSEIYYIYGIIDRKVLIACYLFKTNNIKYLEKGEESKESIDLLASICNCDKELFINGFINSIEKYNKINKNKYINIENISNNNIIINYLLKNSLNAKNISPMAYFFYNYVNRPLLPDKVLIII
jgi:hypothetical protein